MSRNWVAKNDHNRSSVHTDQKKAWEPDILEGIEEHLIEVLGLKEGVYPDPSEIAEMEYRRGVSSSGIC